MELNFKEKAMKKNIRPIITLLAFPLLLAAVSCESVLFIELDEAEKLIVVNGMLATDSTAAVQVSRTRHILDNAAVEPLNNAIVKLYEEDRKVGEMSYTENGWFVLDGFLPSAGKTYSLEVEHDGLPSVKAYTDIPHAVKIQSLDTLYVDREINQSGVFDAGYSYRQERLEYDMSIIDPAGEDNYYLLSAMIDRSWTEWRDTTVKVVDSLYYGGKWNYFLEDSTYTVTDIFHRTEYPYMNSDDIVMEASTSHGLLFSDRLFDGKSYSFRGYFHEWDLRTAEPAPITFYLRTISESCFKYLVSREKHYNTKQDYLAVPVIVYSNVQDGTGFLGGYSADTLTITTFVDEFGDDHYYYY